MVLLCLLTLGLDVFPESSFDKSDSLQVRYPNFKAHSETVIRTALTALDHYSPSIKVHQLFALPLENPFVKD